MSDESTPATVVPQPPVTKSRWDKLGAALPVALTAMATAFAGMSTGELQRAMFWRSYAAQDQARATNQWTFAGLKRDRALICQTTAAQLWATAVNPANPYIGKSAGSPDAIPLEWLAGNGPTATPLPEVADANLERLLSEIQNRAPEPELLGLATKIPATRINDVLNAAEVAVKQNDDNWTPKLKRATAIVAGAPREVATASRAALYELENRRYLIEAGGNQAIGLLYEARVKVSSAESDRHQRKSRDFFYAMLAAQIGATVAALALARQRKSVLWAVAGGAGLAALAIAAYVHLSDL